MKDLTREQIQLSAELITSAQHIVIVTHMSPDGDAMGSALGMSHWLRQLGKTSVDVVVPNSFPDFLHWMPGAQAVVEYESGSQQANQLLEQADLIICTDFNEPKRIGCLGEKLLSLDKTPKILIDHHLQPMDFATVTLSNSDCPSASELVYHFIGALNTQLNQQQDLTLETATCIYTGMMTDTGNFSFNSNHAQIYDIIAHLVRLGINKDAIYNQVFNAYTIDRMRLMGYCLHRKMRIFPDYHTALIFLDSKELNQFHFRSGDAEGIVNLPLQIKDIYYSCFMREDKVGIAEEALANGSPTKIKISLRSQGDRPVNVLAHDIFNGGGHKNASGGEYYGPLPEAAQKFIDAYPNYFTKK